MPTKIALFPGLLPPRHSIYNQSKQQGCEAKENGSELIKSEIGDREEASVTAHIISAQRVLRGTILYRAVQAIPRGAAGIEIIPRIRTAQDADPAFLHRYLCTALADMKRTGAIHRIKVIGEVPGNDNSFIPFVLQVYVAARCIQLRIQRIIHIDLPVHRDMRYGMCQAGVVFITGKKKQTPETDSRYSGRQFSHGTNLTCMHG